MDKTPPAPASGVLSSACIRFGALQYFRFWRKADIQDQYLRPGYPGPQRRNPLIGTDLNMRLQGCTCQRAATRNYIYKIVGPVLVFLNYVLKTNVKTTR